MELHLHVQSFAAMTWLTVYEFICLLCWIEQRVVKGIDGARHSLFVIAKRVLEMLPPFYDALVYIARGYYQA